MALKRMSTKLALAFAAKKGIEVFHKVGGIEGLRAQLAGQSTDLTSRGGMSGRIGGTRASAAGGLGNLLGSLGVAGATNGNESGVTGQISPQNGSLGALFGVLAGAMGHRQQAAQATEDLEAQLGSDSQTDDAEAEAVMRAMVHMVRADGTIDEAEQSALFDILDDASEDERATLKACLREPVDAQAIAADTPPGARKQVYTAALLIGEPDAPQERKFLSDLASALDLKADEVRDLHHAMGKSVIVG